MLIEITNNELDNVLHKRELITIVFVHTPLCGTCKMAKKMIEIVELSFETTPFYSLNINQFPAFAQTWKAESVPCLFIFQKGLGVERIYAFRSISFIHKKLKRYVALTQATSELKGEI